MLNDLAQLSSLTVCLPIALGVGRSLKDGAGSEYWKDILDLKTSGSKYHPETVA